MIQSFSHEYRLKSEGAYYTWMQKADHTYALGCKSVGIRCCVQAESNLSQP